MADLNARLRELPSVDKVLEALQGAAPHPLVVEAVRRSIDQARERVQRGEAPPTVEDVVEQARRLVSTDRRSLLVPVINATGVLVHTNLGRSPLGRKQLEAIVRVAAGYTNLEYDLNDGSRGDRYSHAARLIAAITHAESALVVNNNAAAVLLVLGGLFAGQDVVISRGELVEIGGEFRIPEIIAASGARLVEVGTTNRTKLADYERAIGPNTGAILKVHPSNFRVVGFTTEVAGRDLAKLARGRGLTFVYDAGSGLLAPPAAPGWLAHEPVIGQAITEGADLVTFSGDKLLGGPQAGVIVGRAPLIAQLKKHPLLRALRPDKMTLAALEATLLIYLRGEELDLPLWRMAGRTPEELRERAEKLAADLTAKVPALTAEARPTKAVVGGGAVPGTELDSWGVALGHPQRRPEDLQRALRLGELAVVGRIEDDRLVLDLKTVPPSEDGLVADLVVAALS